MTTILIAILLLSDLILLIVIFDVISSYIRLVGLDIRPKFIGDLIDPIYKKIKDLVPTKFGPLDLTPIVILILLAFIKGLVFAFDPTIEQYYLELTSNF